MNSMSSGPSGYYQEEGFGLRAFFLIVVFILSLVFFASASMSRVDLTPGTPANASQPVTNAAALPMPLPATQPQAAPAQQVVPAQPVVPAVVPVTGATGLCANPYTVQPGDSISKIAQHCGFSTAQVQASNPQIANINVIYPGQQILLPGAAVVSAPATNSAQTSSSAQVLPMPVTGIVNVIRAGTVLQVTGRNFPANIPVNIGIGPQNGVVNNAATGVTDGAGTVVVNIQLPTAGDRTTAWVVTLASASNPVMNGHSEPFFIQ